MSEISFVSTTDQDQKEKKKRSENGKKIEKSNDKHKIFKWIPFRKEKWDKKSYGNTQNN